MSDYENHMVAQGVPEHEDAQDESIFDREARRTVLEEEMMNGDLLDMYLNMGFTGLSDRLIQGAVARAVNQVPEEMAGVVFPYLFKDRNQFTVCLDICIRKHLDESQKDFSAFQIAHSIEVALRKHIEETVECTL